VKDDNEYTQRDPNQTEEASSGAQSDSNQSQAFISDAQRPLMGDAQLAGKAKETDKKNDKETASDGNQLQLKAIDEAIAELANHLTRLQVIVKTALQEQEGNAEGTMPK